jgi:hypothetical protein
VGDDGEAHAAYALLPAASLSAAIWPA